MSLTEWADKSANEVANTAHTATGAITYSDADLGTAPHRLGQAAGYQLSWHVLAEHDDIDSDQSVGWSFTVSDSAIDYLKAGPDPDTKL